MTADFMYGVVGLSGGTDIGPVMVTLGGTASRLLVDGFAGYTIVGDEHSVLAIEARGGVRYQRTDVEASVDVGGSTVTPPQILDTGRDVLVGARVFVRPSGRFLLSSTIDTGVLGTSTSTWSAAADAGSRIGSHVMMSLGWRSLTMEGSHVSMVMQGPRAAVQALF